MLGKTTDTTTYVEYGVEKLKTLCNAVGISHKIDKITEIFRTVAHFSSWGKRTIKETLSWQSDLGDDRAPFEFSVAFDDNQPELRIVIEMQGDLPTLQSNWQAGLFLNQWLAEHFDINLDRFNQIAELFMPTDVESNFCIWHAICFKGDHDPTFKLYLNPQVLGKSLSDAVIEESLMRLGFPRAWSSLASIAAQRGPELDEFVYLSLDLTSHPLARVKVYLRHHKVTSAELERALSASQNYAPGDATEFCQAMIKQQGVFLAKPIVSCFALIEGDDDRPSDGTICLPIAYYVNSDRLIRERLHSYFCQHNLPGASTYDSVIETFATPSLEESIGMQSHITLRREKQRRRITVYLTTGIDQVSFSKPSITRNWEETLLPLEKSIEWYERNPIIHHPFFQRLRRNDVNLRHLWYVCANGREGVVLDFTSRLASVVARIDNEHMRCILAKQLNDELGNGDFSKIHRKLFNKLLAALDPWQPQSITQEMLIPGNEFRKRMKELYFDPNPYVGVGANIVMEICGKLIDTFIDDEFRRTTTTFDPSALIWLNVHVELEIDHVNESFILVSLIPSEDNKVEAVRRGAREAYVAVWQALNGLYRICFL